MGELDDQLRRLAEGRAERTPATEASTVLAGGRPQWRFPMLVAAAAAVVVLLGASLWVFDPGDEDGADVTTNPSTTLAPDPTTSDPDPTTTESDTTEPTTTEPSTTEPDTTEPTTTEPTGPGGDPGTHDAVAATAEGIELRAADGSGRVELVAVGPTVLAFEVGGFLVHQGAGDDSLLWSDGPVWVRPPGADESVALDLGGRFDTLHDARIVDGRPTALVSRRTGDTPETADERLLIVDLETTDTTDLGRFGGWESGVVDGRFGEGLIALHRSAEAVSWIQVIDYGGDELWSTPEELEYPPAIALGPDGVWAVNPGWTDDFTAAELAIAVHDLLTGELVTNSTVTLDPGDDVELTSNCYRRPVVDETMWCGQSSGVPIAIDLSSGAVEPLAGFTAGVVTPVDAEATSTAPSS